MGGEPGEGGWVPLLRGLACQARQFVLVSGRTGEPLKISAQESGSAGGGACQENLAGAGRLRAES